MKTDKEKEEIGIKGAEELSGSCSGVYDKSVCPDDVELSDFLEWVEIYGEVKECEHCGWYCETHEFDEENRCQDCQDE